MPYKAYIKTITTDNGTELVCHEMISKALDTKIYIADPYSSWQKGAIENENRLIRQNIPKSSSFAGYYISKQPNLYTRLSSDQEKN